jgi:ribonuclease P protein component
MELPTGAGGKSANHSPPPPTGNAEPVAADHPPAARIRHGGEFSRVFHQQQKAAGRFLVVLVRRRGGAGPPRRARLGMMVAAKTVRTAVRRHAIKRWLREAFRTSLCQIAAGYDVVVLLRGDPVDHGGHVLVRQEFAALLPQALAAVARPGARNRRR